MKSCLFLILFSASIGLDAQVAGDPLKDILERDSATVEALAMYSDSIRSAALKTCLYPELIVRAGELQKRSSSAFRDIMTPLTKEDQKAIWDLARYDGLAERVSAGGKKSASELKQIAVDYPSISTDKLVQYGQSHYDVFVKIADLGKKTSAEFEEMTKGYTPEIRSAFRTVIRYPELASLLEENIKTSVLLGDAYRKNNKQLMTALDSLNLELARRNANDVNEWKKGLEQDPDAKKEMEKSAKEYAKEQGYDEQEYSGQKETIVITEYVYYPYSWWYGYPWWWDHPYWYPYPYWYHWGYYYGPYGIVYTGCPSWYFIHWHFHHHHHHYYYPHFSSYVVGYYHGPRRSANGVRAGVGHWLKENDGNIPSNLLKPGPDRADRLKAFGKLEMDRDNYNKTNPDKPKTRDEYYKENGKGQPDLGNIPRQEKEKPKHYELAPIPRQPRKDPVITPRFPDKAPRPNVPKSPPPVIRKPK